jgi:biopolymer transport protein ExbD
MQVNQFRRRTGVMVDINTTPLIDVMLVLLIMLIITIPIQMHSVKMNLPVGDPPPPATPPPVVQVDIDCERHARGTARIFDRADLEA